MESGKGQAEKQEKRDGFDNIPKYNVSIISDGTADGGKEHEGSAADAEHLHHDLKRRQTSLPFSNLSLTYQNYGYLKKLNFFLSVTCIFLFL